MDARHNRWTSTQHAAVVPIERRTRPSESGDKSGPIGKRLVRCFRFKSGFSAILLSLGFLATAAAQEPVKSPVEPKATLANFVIHPDFEIQLAACEPQVVDPVAIRFDEYDNLWVVEMRDYPHGPAEGEKPKSRIKILRDNDKDGFYETSHVFADNLLFATGVQPYNAPDAGTKDDPNYGVIVTLAGKVQWMSDTDGDFTADVVETWFEGFKEDNPQLRANDPTMGPGGWIYVANGLRNGVVRAVKDEWKDQPPVTLRSQDFRFHPKSGKFEAVSGYGQFGMTFDEMGHRFVCSNRNPCNHVILPQQYLNRNPFLVRTDTVEVVSPAAAASRVYAISKPWTTSTLHAGQFTAACGVTIYRGDSFPEQFRGNSFTCEPTGNLVHRDVLIPDGPTFKARYGREGVEFLASRDNWFRPVNLANAPDGCLYVVDMYRAVIEHPQFMPAELKVRKDLSSGNDRGRLYRVVSKVNKHKPAPPLDPLSERSAAAWMAQANGWHKTTGQRVWLRQVPHEEPHVDESGDYVPLPVTEPVGGAYWRLLALGRYPNDRNFVAKAASMIDHDQHPRTIQALLTLPPQFSVAILQKLAGWDDPAKFHDVFPPLAHQIALRNKNDETAIALEAITTLPDALRKPAIIGLAAGLSRRGKRVLSIAKSLPVEKRTQLKSLFAGAVQQLASENAGIRLDAIRFAKHGVNAEMADVFAHLATTDKDTDVRVAAIEALGRFQSAAIATRLLADFTNQTPRVQRAIVTSCASRPAAATVLLEEVTEKQIPPSTLDSATQRVLRRYKEPKLQSAVGRALASLVPADRKAVLADYADCVKLKSDPARGRIVFEKHCATCHRIGSLGIDIAPDIADSRSKTPEYLLLNILDPNRAVDANYFSYTAVTTEGKLVTGIVASETASSVTLKQAEGKLTTLLRADLEELKNNGISLMPTGLEKSINKQQMADLISFIKNWRYLDGDIPIDLITK